MTSSWGFWLLIGAICVGVVVFINKRDEEWGTRFKKQLWAERVRLMLLYAMINRLKIGFEFADLSDHSFEGHVKWFKLAEDGRIAVLLGSPGEKPRVLDIAFAKYAKTKVS